MSKPVELPSALINELWNLFKPRDSFAPLKGGKKPTLGVCHSARSCFGVKAHYDESYASLRALKDLKCVVDELAAVLRDGIEEIEEVVLPLSRYHGIRTLPCEIMVKIMTIVSDQCALQPKSFKGIMKAFWDVEPFNAHFVATGSLRKNWQDCDTIWDSSRLPDTSLNITKFIFSASNCFKLGEVLDGLRPLKTLRHLDICCEFDYNAIANSPIPESQVTLEQLKTLRVSNSYLYENVDCDWTMFLSEKKSPGTPLRRIVRWLDMPNLEHINTSLFTAEPAMSFLNAVDEVFRFPHRVYGEVKSFTIEKIRVQDGYANGYIDLVHPLTSMPSLKSISIASLERLLLEIDSKNLEVKNLRFIELCYGTPSTFHDCGWDAKKLITALLRYGAPLVEITVKTAFEEIFSDIQDAFPNTRWVTDRSILDCKTSYNST